MNLVLFLFPYLRIMSSVLIVAATKNDVPQILDIVNHYIENDTCIYDLEPRALEKQMEWFENQTSNNYPVLAAKIDNQLIGFASYSQFRPKVGYKFCMEHSVYVAHNQKGNGDAKNFAENYFIFQYFSFYFIQSVPGFGINQVIE